jgi:hypothetical protein
MTIDIARSTIRTVASLAAVAIVAGSLQAAGARPLSQRAGATQPAHSLFSGARAPLALSPGAIANLHPGRSLYSNRHRFGPNFAYTHANVVFGSDYAANEVDVFKQSAGFPYVATLSDAPPNACGQPQLQGPQGMWVDHQRNLWVADTYNSDVREFPLGQTTSAVSLSDPGYYPVGTTVDATVTGNVYATNIISTSATAGNIVGWTPPFTCGQAPNIVLSDPSFATVYFASTDALGDLYVDYIDTTSTPRVCYIPAPIPATSTTICSAPTAITTVQLGFPGGMQVLPLPASINKIGIDDQIGNAPVSLGIGIYKLPLPTSGPRDLPCTNVSPPYSTGIGLGPFSDPVTFAFTNPKGYDLWASDAAVTSGGALLETREKVCAPTYPGAFAGKITGFAQLIGTAVSPSVSP